MIVTSLARIVFVALVGLASGVVGALAFYAVAGAVGYLAALLIAWVFMWMVLAAVSAWLRTELTMVGRWVIPGLVAAAGSGLTFYLVSGIWTEHPEARNYVWHLAAWTFAWAPGVIALTWRQVRL